MVDLRNPHFYDVMLSTIKYSFQDNGHQHTCDATSFFFEIKCRESTRKSNQKTMSKSVLHNVCNITTNC